MKVRSIFAAIALVACGSLSAQNATKADLAKLESQVNALSQKVAKLEANLERVITENVNLVEQLNIKTLSSVTDVNNIQWDIVKVSPNADTGDVVVTLRVTNNSGRPHKVGLGFNIGSAVDSNSNLGNNVYYVKSADDNPDLSNLAPNTPVNIKAIVQNVPNTSVYLSSLTINYSGTYGKTEKGVVKFTGVHISR